MAPKKDLQSFGSVQPVGDGWRVEAGRTGRGPKRATLPEAMQDLASARQAGTREDMTASLKRIRQEVGLAQSLAGQADASARTAGTEENSQPADQQEAGLAQSLAGQPAANAPVPTQLEEGRRILVLVEPWLQMVRDGTKTLEIRHQRLSAGPAYIGTSSHVFAEVHLGEAIEVKAMEHWRSLEELHRWGDQESLPYASTFGLPLLDMNLVSPPVPYKRQQGARGISTFRPA